MDTRAVVAAWLERWIVGADICPFAAAPVRAERVRIAVCASAQPEDWVDALLAELTRLVDAPLAALETTLLALPEAPEDFEDFLGVMALGDQVLAAGGWEGVVQLVAFHPRFRYDGSHPEDPGNWTNRAPLPLIHLLREDSVARIPEEQAIAVSDRNQTYTEAVGAAACRRLAWGEDERP